MSLAHEFGTSNIADSEDHDNDDMDLEVIIYDNYIIVY